MEILISIDDTDSLDSPGSGQLSENLAQLLQQQGLADCANITRHQLFAHPDIPYTSHNSAMCFTARIGGEVQLARILTVSKAFITEQSAEGSDPGLAIALADLQLQQGPLIDFGQRAKQTILTKEEAYALAKDLGVHLSEHGGTGGGVIGALAAIGLRLQGNDGRFRGWYHFGKAGSCTTPAELISRHPFIDAVVDDQGQALASHISFVFAEDTVKTVLIGGGQVVPLQPRAANDGTQWSTLTKREVKRF